MSRQSTIRELWRWLEGVRGVDVEMIKPGPEPFSFKILLEDSTEAFRVPQFWQDYKLIVVECETA